MSVSVTYLEQVCLKVGLTSKDKSADVNGMNEIKHNGLPSQFQGYDFLSFLHCSPSWVGVVKFTDNKLDFVDTYPDENICLQAATLKVRCSSMCRKKKVFYKVKSSLSLIKGDFYKNIIQ